MFTIKHEKFETQKKIFKTVKAFCINLIYYENLNYDVKYKDILNDLKSNHREAVLK